MYVELLSAGAQYRLMTIHERTNKGPLLGDSCYAYPVNGKAIPLQACRGPEGSRRLRLPDFKTIGT